jgi:hypothetical protein
VALLLLERLHALGWFRKHVAELRQDLRIDFRLDHPDDDAAIASTVTHVVVAALMQDVGELPSKQVLADLVSPHRDLRSTLVDEFGSAYVRLEAKVIFTLSAAKEAIERLDDDSISLPLLAFLLTGLPPEGSLPGRTLESLKRLLNGAVDADRLDYIPRDSYFTVGLPNAGSLAERVVWSVCDLNPSGLVFSDPAPVSLLLLQRAILRSEVFSAGPVRLRSTLLALSLAGLIREKPDLFDSLIGSDRGHLTLPAFLDLDDRRIEEALHALRSMRSLSIGTSATRALRTIGEAAPEYSYVWLPKSHSPNPKKAPTIPEEVFFDPLHDAEHHYLFEPDSVFVSGEQWELAGGTVALERTGGHVAQFMAAGFDVEPIAGQYLCFIPDRKRSKFIETLATLDEDGLAGLYRSAIDRDTTLRATVNDNTIGDAAFTGPVIFVSFCGEDASIARRLLAELARQGRRYVALMSPNSGIGGTPRANSVELAQTCDAAIMLLSREYVRRYTSQDGNVSVEVQTFIKRVPGLPLVALTVDPLEEYGDLEKAFPWVGLGFEGPLFAGAPLWQGSAGDIRDAVQASLKAIDAAFA